MPEVAGITYELMDVFYDLRLDDSFSARVADLRGNGSYYDDRLVGGVSLHVYNHVHEILSKRDRGGTLLHPSSQTGETLDRVDICGRLRHVNLYGF